MVAKAIFFPLFQMASEEVGARHKYHQFLSAKMCHDFRGDSTFRIQETPIEKAFDDERLDDLTRKSKFQAEEIALKVQEANLTDESLFSLILNNDWSIRRPA